MLITNGCSSSTFFKAFVTYVARSSCLVGNDFECPAEMLRFALSFHSREEKKITVDSIYMGKPVDSWFGQMVSKNQDW